MASVSFSPVFNGYQGFSSSGLPLAGGLINTYQAGTSTPLETYTTSAGTIAGTNPIVLGPDGRPPTEIWLVTGSAYKFVLTDSLSNVLGTYDNVSGIVTNGALTGITDLTMTGNLSVGGNATIDGDLEVDGGTSFQALSSQTFSAAAQPSFSAERITSSQAIGSTSTPLIFNGSLFDLTSSYDAATGIYTVPQDGRYLVCVNVVVINTSGGIDTLLMALGGVGPIIVASTGALASGASATLTISTIANLATSAAVNVNAQGVTGSWSLLYNPNGGLNRGCVFSMAKLS